MKTLLLALALAGTVSLAVAAPQVANNPTKSGASVAPAGVAADVNGEKITLADLNRRVEDIKATEPALQTNTPTAQQALTNMRARILDDLIVMQLLGQEARRRKISTPAKDVDELVAQTKKQFKTEAEFNKWLNARGVSPTQFRSRLVEELAMDELTAQITSDVTVAEADIATFYRANPAAFTTPAMVKARHILLAINPAAAPADKDVVRKRASGLIKQIKGGADFAALAKANSDDQSNKDKGGDLGAFERGMMVPAFEKAAFDAKAGDIVGPVETNFGFHVIKIDAVIPAKLVDLKDVKDDRRLRALVLRAKKQERFDAFVAELKAKAKIQRYV